MKDFQLPFRPEECRNQPTDDRLWASRLPDVDCMSNQQVEQAVNDLIRGIMQSQGKSIAEEKNFNFVFALVDAWPRLEPSVQLRLADVVSDAAGQILSEAGKLQRMKKTLEQDKTKDVQTAAKVAIFFVRWVAEKMLRKQKVDEMLKRGRGRGGKRKDDEGPSEAELKEFQKQIERQRMKLLTSALDLATKGPAMPWLWASDAVAWTEVAQASIDTGLLVLDNVEALKIKELKQVALRCVSQPLLQEGIQLSNLMLNIVSRLTHAMRGVENSHIFAAEVLLQAHTTPLPRMLVVDLTKACAAGELTSQHFFQRSMGSFLVAMTERLPHLMLANVSLLLPLLDVDTYPLRQAIVESIGHILGRQGLALPKGARCSVAMPAAADQDEIKEEPDSEAPDSEAPGHDPVRNGVFTVAEATQKDLLETLLTRSTDKTSWVRAKVLYTLRDLAENMRVAALPRDQWPRVMEIAAERLRDVSSNVRKAAMQLVRTLIELHPYGPALSGSGSERSKAEALLKEVLERKQRLRDAELAEEAAEAGAVLAAQEHAEAEEAQEPADKRRRKKGKLGTETAAQEVERCLASEALKDVEDVKSEEASEAEDSEAARRRAERTKQRNALNRMQECYTQRLRFVNCIDDAEVRLRSLLSSKTATDVTEAINVVVELRLRGLPAATRAFNQVLGLVWSRTASVKDAAVEAFGKMHLSGKDTAETVTGLINMYHKGVTSEGGWTYTHLASVQELIKEAAIQKLVDPKRTMREIALALDGPMCMPALRAFTAFCDSDPEEVVAALPRLVARLKGHTELPTQDRLESQRLICQLLERMVGARQSLPAQAWEQVASLLHSCVYGVVEAVTKGDVPPAWFGAAQAAMDLGFEVALHEDPATPVGLRCPDKLWETILERLLRLILGRAPPGADGADADAGTVVAFEGGAPASDVVLVSTRELSCAIFLAGHLGLRMLVFLEGMQLGLKKRRLAEEDVRMKEKNDKKRMKEGQKTTKGKKGKEAAAAPEEEDDEADGTALGMAGQEEREAEAFAELAETVLLYGAKSLLHRTKPLIKTGLFDPAFNSDPVLRRLAALSLCKFMTVSRKFCQEHLQLLFSVLFPKPKDNVAPLLVAAAANDPQDMELVVEDAAQPHVFAPGKSGGLASQLLEDTTLRQSLLVAVGDLLFRHPNVVEPWTERLYASLSLTETDSTGSVEELRLTALLVLTHLVLGGMMKPRADLLARALWLTANPNEKTAKVARILFQELSRKSNAPLYNSLPFVVELLPEHEGPPGFALGTAEDRVRYLAQFIEKEKHTEGLIEKLSTRLKKVSDLPGTRAAEAADEDAGPSAPQEQRPSSPEKLLLTIRCVSAALASLNYTERCLSRLHDVLVVRKMLSVAMQYHSCVRENILGVVERMRAKAKDGRKGPAGEAAAPAGEGENNGEKGKGGLSEQAATQLDQIERLVMGMEKGVDEDGNVQDSRPASEAVPVADAEPEAEAKPRRGPKRGRKAAEDIAESMVAAPPELPFEDTQEGAMRAFGGAKREPSRAGAMRAFSQPAAKGRGRPKRAKVMASDDDDDDYVE